MSIQYNELDKNMVSGWRDIGSTSVNSDFGADISLNYAGNLIAVNAPVVKSVFIYRYNTSTNDWDKQELSSSQANYVHGKSVSLDGTGELLVIGSPNDSTSGVNGLISIYKHNINTNAWEFVVSKVGDGPPNDGFGRSVSINNDGDTIVVGAPEDTTNNGKIYIYTKDGATFTKVFHNNGTATELYGDDVVINANGTLVVVGCPDRNDGFTDNGRVEILAPGGGSWGVATTISGPPENDARFGEHLALNGEGDFLAAGMEDALGGNGRIRMLRDTTNWLEDGTIDGTGSSSSRVRGEVSVDLSGKTMVITTGTTGDSAAKIYEYDNSWGLSDTILADSLHVPVNATISGASETLAFSTEDDNSGVGVVTVYSITYTNTDAHNFIVSGTQIILPLPPGFSHTNITSSSNDNPLVTIIASTVIGNNIVAELSVSQSVSGVTFTFNFGTVPVVYTNVNITIQEEICLLKDTEITTDQGRLLIQDITTKNTINGQNIKEISTQLHSGEFILFKKHCLCYNEPNKDTYITSRHRVFYKDKVDHAKNWINDDDILEHQFENSKRVYNIWLDKPRVGRMYANNISVETLDPLIFKTRAKPYNMKMIKK